MPSRNAKLVCRKQIAEARKTGDIKSSTWRNYSGSRPLGLEIGLELNPS